MSVPSPRPARWVLALLLVLLGSVTTFLVLRDGAGTEREGREPVPADAEAPVSGPGDAPAASHVQRSGRLAERVHVTHPEPGRAVFPPVVVVGWAPGGWYFEATFPLHLTDASGTAVADSFASAEGAWMVPEQVPFRGVLRAPGASHGPGTLVMERANASGLPEHDAEVRIPLRLAGSAVPRIYFPNSILDPEALDCTRVFPVARAAAVPPARAGGGVEVTARELLAQLLAGPRPGELEAGYHTALPESAGLRGIALAGDTLTVDFDAGVSRDVGGSCRVLAIRAQVDSTLARLPGVRHVVIAVEGRTEGVLQP